MQILVNIFKPLTFQTFINLLIIILQAKYQLLEVCLSKTQDIFLNWSIENSVLKP